MAESGFEGQETSSSKAFTQGAKHVVGIKRRFTKSLLPTPSHWAASAAKGKGSDGPVRRRRKTGTLSEMGILGFVY